VIPLAMTVNKNGARRAFCKHLLQSPHHSNSLFVQSVRRCSTQLAARNSCYHMCLCLLTRVPSVPAAHSSQSPKPAAAPTAARS
jgi:hypothetical protein